MTPQQRQDLLDRDAEIVQIINADEGFMSAADYDALLEEKAAIEIMLMEAIHDRPQATNPT